MKRKRILSVIVTIIAIIGFAVLLIFLPRDEKPSDGENLKPITTSLYVDLPDTINILVGTQAKIDDDAVVVTPKEKFPELKHEIIVKSTGSVGGITFDGSIITAKSLGKYAIKFSVPKSELSVATKTVNINVYDEKSEAHTRQLINEVLCNENIAIDEIFSNLSGKTYTIQTDIKTSVSENVLNAFQVGESDITITFNENNVSFIYNFKLLVKSIPEYYIVLNDVENNYTEVNLSDGNKFVAYEIFDKHNDKVFQLVTIQSNNELVATAICDRFGLIKITALSQGEATLTIISVEDETVKIDLNIFVK